MHSPGENVKFSENPEAGIPQFSLDSIPERLSAARKQEVQKILTQTGCKDHQAMQYVFLREHILYALESLLQATNLARNLSGFVNAMQAMRHALTCFTDPVVIRLLYCEPHYTDLKNKLRPLNNLYLRFLEESAAQAMLSENPRIFLQPDWRPGIADEELRTRLSNKSHELTALARYDLQASVCVGCGSFPDTIVYLREHTTIPHITGLDSEYSSASTASMIVNALQKGQPEDKKRIQIQRCYGEEYEYQGVGHIHIAGYVPDKDVIIRRAIATNPGQRMIVTAENYAHSPFHLLHDDLEPRLTPLIQSGRLRVIELNHFILVTK